MSEDSIWLAEQWVAQLGPAIGSMTGALAEAVRLDSAGPVGPGESDLTWLQPVNTAPNSALWAAFSEPVWSGLGRQVLQAAGLESSDEAEIRGTALEILQQSLSPLSSAIGSRLGREAIFENGRQTAQIEENLSWQAVEIRIGGQVLGKAWLAANASLLASLSTREETEPARGRPAVSPTKKPAPTMDLLLEVELPVGVSFGRAQMRLKDAVKLTTGSIVELNRSITEPVEVLVNNCVIARGEVVVVEGNYGVRIQQIVSREERLRTLF